MTGDAEKESCDSLDKKELSDDANESFDLPSLGEQSQTLLRSHSVHSILSDSSKNYLNLKNVQYSTPPSVDVCKMAVVTFEKMDLANLRMLEKYIDILRDGGQISIDELKSFTTATMMEVWRNDEKMSQFLRSHSTLMGLIGRELLVLFDNVMSEPVYEVTESGKPQRYTRACLDNSIQPVYNCNIPQNKWNTFETVISTYTAPTSFTPEMETLIRTAAQLGISTNDLSLKNFGTERSLSAFLKRLIDAKQKKNAFIKKFNTRLLGVLHQLPNLDDTGLTNKFKYSFSKLCQFITPTKDSKSTPEFRHTTIKRYSTKSFGSRYSLHKGGLFASERMGDFTMQRHQRGDANNNCNKCHETSREKIMRQGLVKSFSDSFLSLATCESVNCCKCFDKTKRALDKRETVTAKRIFTTKTKFVEIKKRSNLKHPQSPMKEFKTASSEKKESFTLLSEQRSFFRLGEGAKRDILAEYVEAKTANITREITKKSTKKRVRWIDETSFSSLYGSLMDSESEYMVIGTGTAYNITPNRSTPLDKFLRFVLQEPSDERLAAFMQRPIKRIIFHGFVQATVMAVFFWICYLFYLQTPEYGKKLRRLSLGPWLQIFEKKSII